MIMRQLLCSKLTLIQNYLFYTGFVSEVIPLLFCILFYKKLHTKALKVFFVYAVTLAFSSVLSLVFLRVLEDRVSYFLIVRLFNIAEYSIVIYFFYHLYKSQLARKIILFSVPPFIIYAMIDYLWNSKTQFNNHSNIVSALLLIFCIVYFFFEQMKTVVMYPLYQSVSFWISVGLFLNFTGIFFFILFINSSNDKNFKILMNSTVGLVTILKNVLLSLSLLASENTEEQEDNILRIPNEIELDEFSLTDFKSP